MKETIQTFILQGKEAVECGEAIAKHFLLERKADPDAMGQIKALPAHGDCVRLFIGPAWNYLGVVKRFATAHSVKVIKDDPMLYGEP